MTVLGGAQLTRSARTAGGVESSRELQSQLQDCRDLPRYVAAQHVVPAISATAEVYDPSDADLFRARMATWLIAGHSHAQWCPVCRIAHCAEAADRRPAFFSRTEMMRLLALFRWVSSIDTA